eukprot:4839044-Pleurochrysis_carterae.AAC.6
MSPQAATWRMLPRAPRDLATRLNARRGLPQAVSARISRQARAMKCHCALSGCPDLALRAPAELLTRKDRARPNWPGATKLQVACRRLLFVVRVVLV